MAGIGFELRKMLKRDTLTHDMIGYGMAGIISSGPWIISILGILILGGSLAIIPSYFKSVTQFQISVTYLIACSLIFSGFAQHSFTRYISDQLYLHHISKIVPNLNGMTFVLSTLAGITAFILVIIFFPQQSIFYRFTLIGSFVVLCNIWMTTNILAGLKNYKLILLGFFISYSIVGFSGYFFRNLQLDGFMFSFFIGQLFLLFSFHFAIFKHYPAGPFIEFDFIKRTNLYPTLILTSFFYNFGIWIDKFIFWYTPSTSYNVIGYLRGSLIYDVPIFLAYLALIPGMAVFLMRIETDFADYYYQFFSAIRDGQPINHIQTMRDRMVEASQSAIIDIIKVQAVTVVFVFLLAEKILYFLHISILYKNLLFIDSIGASLQVVLLAMLNILCYLDRRREVLILCAIFLVGNCLLTLLSIYAGPLYYGYGFTIALALTCAQGAYMLQNELTDIDYKTIMLR